MQQIDYFIIIYIYRINYKHSVPGNIIVIIIMYLSYLLDVSSDLLYMMYINCADNESRNIRSLFGRP